MEKLISLLLILVGIINAYPVIGVVSATKLQTLYGVTISDANLIILMRHRAVLFGLLGGFIIYSAFSPNLQPIALILGFISMLTFILLAALIGNYNIFIRKVVMADIIASIMLLIAAALYILNKPAG